VGSNPITSTKSALFKPSPPWVWGAEVLGGPVVPVWGGGFLGSAARGGVGLLGELVAEEGGEGLGEVAATSW
jgi:hypothetical protein